MKELSVYCGIILSHSEESWKVFQAFSKLGIDFTFRSAYEQSAAVLRAMELLERFGGELGKYFGVEIQLDNCNYVRFIGFDIDGSPIFMTKRLSDSLEDDVLLDGFLGHHYTGYRSLRLEDRPLARANVREAYDDWLKQSRARQAGEKVNGTVIIIDADTYRPIKFNYPNGKSAFPLNFRVGPELTGFTI